MQAFIDAVRNLFQPGPKRVHPRELGAHIPSDNELDAIWYARNRKLPSFVDKLPWLDFLPESQSFLLEDGRSVGAILDITPVGTEGRSKEFMIQLRNAIQHALQTPFDGQLYDVDDGPWVVQMYVYDEYDLSGFVDEMRSYVWPHARDSEYTAAFLAEMERHIAAISRPGGLFEDKTVTGAPWQGRWRRAKLAICRRQPKGKRLCAAAGSEQELNDMIERIEASLRKARVVTRRVGREEFFSWMVRWLNPKPRDLTPAEIREYHANKRCGDPKREVRDDHETTMWWDDFSEGILGSFPRSDWDNRVWWFDDLPHRCLSLQKLSKIPELGTTTAELEQGRSIYAMFDQMPEHTIMCLTVITTPQDRIEEHLNRLEKSCVADNAETRATVEAIAGARKLLTTNHRLYKGSLAFFTRGENLDDQLRNANAIRNVASSHGITLIKDDDDLCCLNAYLMNLPLAWDPRLDKHTEIATFMYAEHAADLCPLYGRSTGTGHPGMTFFNRGGSPLTFDPLSLKDRKKNAHLLMFGPTGAGKSATLNYIAAQVMAMVRPRMVVVEAGNSFGLLADYFERQGLTVNRVALKPGANVSLAPFADAHWLVDKSSAPGLESGLDDDEEADDGDEQRDVLGELETIAVLMITGAEAKEIETMGRIERSMIRKAIQQAAETAYGERRDCLTEDVQGALFAMSRDPNLPESQRTRTYQMAECMGYFTQGFEGELFNRPGTPWPDADFTLVDLATYAREGYTGQLAVAYTALMQRINNLAEKYQYDERPLINLNDEDHITTKIPLLAPYKVKIVKMWRKLGAWYWAATQNLGDYPGEAKMLLNMIEWWILLVPEKDEVEQVARFKQISEEQKKLILSARKEPGKYTEGIVLSQAVEALFRNVPPSLYLALAMTEKDEKVERKHLMQEHGISELDAAIRVAQRLDRSRGLA